MTIAQDPPQPPIVQVTTIDKQNVTPMNGANWQVEASGALTVLDASAARVAEFPDGQWTCVMLTAAPPVPEVTS